jgi:hypothetical protein
MSKKSAPPPGDVLAAIGDGAQLLSLTPGFEAATDEMRQLKSRFWLALRSNPIAEDTAVSPALVEQLTGRSVQKWLSDERFWPWFSTRDSTKQYLEVAAEKAAELALFYLNPAVPFNDNARASLMKLVLEYSGRTPPSTKVVKWQDKEIGELSEDQLNAFIDKLLESRARKKKQLTS